jgi:hypothetical protein
VLAHWHQMAHRLRCTAPLAPDSTLTST